MWFSLWVLSLIGSTSEDISDHNVLRLNLGVNFEMIDRLKLKTATYTWDFILPLPKVLYDLHPEEYMSSSSIQERVLCPDSMGGSIIRGARNQDCPAEILDLIKTIMKVNVEDKMEIASLISQINNSVPSIELSDQNRGQRSLFSGGGSLLSYVFGLTSERERDAIIQRVQKLEALVVDKDKTIHHTFQSLVTGEKLLDKRITNLASYVNQATNQTIQHLERIELGFKREIAWFGELLQRYIVLNKNTRDLVQHLEQFLTDIQLLGVRRLSVNLVPVQTMRNVKNTLELNLHRAGQDVLLFPVLTEVMEYYRDPEFHYFKLNDSLVISLKIHLSAYKDAWDIYKITKLPVVINGEETRSTILEDDMEYIALYRGGTRDQLYIPLSMDDVFRAQTKRVIQSKIVHKNKDDNCIMAIFNNNRVLSNKLCKYTLTLTQSVPRGYALSQTQFYFVGMVDYTKQCFTHRREASGLDKVKESGGLVVTGKRALVLDLTNLIPMLDSSDETLCRIDTTYFSVVPTLLQRGQAKGQEVHTYTVNLIFLAKAFGPEKMSQIQGDTLLQTYPNISFRRLKVADGTSDFIATDHNLKLNFEKVINHTKMNKKQPYSHTEAILERIQFRDNFSVMDILSMVQGGVLVLLLFAVFIMAKKLRAIMAILVVVQAQISNKNLVNAGEEGEYYTSDTDEEDPDEWNQQVAEIHDMVTNNISDNYIFYLVAIIILYFLKMGLYYLYKRWTSPVKDSLWRTDLVIRIQPLTTDKRRENPVFLSVQTIMGLPRELQVLVKGQITSVVIGGSIFMTLKYVWKGTIHNIFTDHIIPIKQSVAVPLFVGPWLKEILAGDYIIQPILVNNKHLYRVENFLTKTDVKAVDKKRGGRGVKKGTSSKFSSVTASMPNITGGEHCIQEEAMVTFEHEPGPLFTE